MPKALRIESLFDHYDSYRVPEFPARKFPPELFHDVADRLIRESGGLVSARQLGQSYEGRPIRHITTGTGPVALLLWSQMHGDESTGTMAIADILHALILTREAVTTRKILSALTLHFVPMLNPDGAARFQRRTAQGIDMNRDAHAQRTPEARLLAALQHRLKPDYGFNLHDQELSTVGSTKNLTAIAVLAPAYEAEKSYNPTRTRGKQIASFIASITDTQAPGSIARYDDSYEPRAFGDNFQKWGTSTILIESGHARNDEQKDFIRKLNVVALMSSFGLIADGAVGKVDTRFYDTLPLNGKRAYDLIVRGILIEDGNGERLAADLGISHQVDTHSEPPPRLVDIGDLHTHASLTEIDGQEKILPRSLVRLGEPFDWRAHFG